MQKFYIDSNGVYIGSGDGAIPPGAVAEVPSMPAYGGSTWDGSQWVDPKVKDLPTQSEKLEALWNKVIRSDSTEADAIEAEITK